MDSPSHETVCQIADRLTNKDRMEAYGHPKINFDDIARMWSVILRPILQPGQSVTPTQVGLCNVASKICRHVARPKRDNLIDMAGYANTIDKLDEPSPAPDWTCGVCGMTNPDRYFGCDNGCIEPVPDFESDVDPSPEASARAMMAFERSLERQPPHTHKEMAKSAIPIIDVPPSFFVDCKHTEQQLRTACLS